MKKVLSLLLAVTMLAVTLLLAACRGKNEPEITTTTSSKTAEATSSATTEKHDVTTTDSGSTTASTQATETSETSSTSSSSQATVLTGKEKHPDFMDVNFGGKTFNFVVSKGWSGGWDCYEIYAEATGNDDIITEAIINRNSVVESLYNCKIRHTQAEYPHQLVANDVALGTSTYDFHMQLFYTSSANGINIANLDIDLSHSWWNQEYINAFGYTYNGTKILPSISGKFNLIMYDSIATMFADMDVYDRAVASGKTNIDLYQTVKDGKWTIDTMITLMEAAKVDVNGDQQLKFEDGDIFGFLANANVLPQYGFIYGSGLKSVIKNENDAFESLNTTNTDISYVSSVIDKAATVFKSSAYGQIGELNSVKAVANGQALFNVQWIIRLHSKEELINYGIDFSEKRLSVIPFPKYSEDQEEYGTFICNRGYGLIVPKTITDAKATSQFLEVFGYHSEMLLYPEYIKCIKTQCLCDEEAGEMLEIVLKSARCDYGVWNLNTGLAGRMGEMIASGKNNFSKAVASASKTCQQVLDSVMKDIYDRSVN